MKLFYAIRIYSLVVLAGIAAQAVEAGSNPDKVNKEQRNADGEIMLKVETQHVGSSFDLNVDPYSLTIIRIPNP